MAADELVVNQAEGTPASDSTSEQSEPVSNESELVQTPKTDDIKDNLKRALSEERQRRKELEERLRERELEESNVTPIGPDADDIARRFTETEANSKLAVLMMRDDFVKQNLDLIQDEMQRNHVNVDNAIKAVKASVFDRLQQESKQPAPKGEKPLQINSNPLPEAPVAERTGNAYHDALAGKLDDELSEEDRMLVEALRQA